MGSFYEMFDFDVAVVSKSVMIETLIMIVYFGRVSRVDSNLVHEISRSFSSRSTLLGKNLSAVQS